MDNVPELGRLVKEYKRSPARLRQIVLIMLFSAVMASCVLVPALTDPSLSPLWKRIALSFVGLFLGLPVFVGLRELLRLRGVSLTLYTNGLIYRARGKDHATAWREIDSFIEESACRITKKDGGVIEFGTGIEGADEVIETIRKQTLKRMLPDIKAAVLDGSSVQFKGARPFKNGLFGRGLNNFAYASSGFAVDARGVTAIDTGERIAWKDVTDYGIAPQPMGRIMVDVFLIQSADRNLRSRLGLLENAHVLLALCEEMVALNGPERESPELATGVEPEGPDIPA